MEAVRPAAIWMVDDVLTESAFEPSRPSVPHTIGYVSPMTTAEGYDEKRTSGWAETRKGDVNRARKSRNAQRKG